MLRCFQIQGLMVPVGVVVVLKLSQLLFQIAFVPEKNLIQILSPDGADEPLGEWVRQRCVGNGFNLFLFPEFVNWLSIGGSGTKGHDLS